MKKKPKNVNTPVAVILYLLAALFLVYGIYMAYDAVVYVRTYDSNDAVSTTNMLQYVVAASASYFGFAIIIFAAASIITSLNKVQYNLYRALSFNAMREEEMPEAAPDPAAEPLEPAMMEPDTPSELLEPVDTIEPAESIEMPEPTAAEAPTEPVMQAEAEAPAEPVMQAEAEAPAEPVMQVETEAPAAPVEPIEQPVPMETPTPIKPAAPEISIPAETAALEVVVDTAETLPLAEELSAQFLAEPSAPPASRPPMAGPETPPAAEPAPAGSMPFPEEILQTKRKRGLKYETVSLGQEKPEPEEIQNLSNTIRLKKEDRDALSSAFIRDIMENRE